MFDIIGRNVAASLEADSEAAPVSQPVDASGTIAGLLAALYADPADANVLFVPSLYGLHLGFGVSLESGALDAAAAIAIEIARLSGGDSETDPATLYGNKAGLWRLH